MQIVPTNPTNINTTAKAKATTLDSIVHTIKTARTGQLPAEDITYQLAPLATGWQSSGPWQVLGAEGLGDMEHKVLEYHLTEAVRNKHTDGGRQIPIAINYAAICEHWGYCYHGTTIESIKLAYNNLIATDITVNYDGVYLFGDCPLRLVDGKILLQKDLYDYAINHAVPLYRPLLAKYSRSKIKCMLISIISAKSYSTKTVRIKLSSISRQLYGYCDRYRDKVKYLRRVIKQLLEELSVLFDGRVCLSDGYLTIYDDLPTMIPIRLKQIWSKVKTKAVKAKAAKAAKVKATKEGKVEVSPADVVTKALADKAAGLMDYDPSTLVWPWSKGYKAKEIVPLPMPIIN